MTHPKVTVSLVLCLFILSPTLSAGQPQVPTYGEGWDVYVTSSGMALKDRTVYMTWPSGARRKERVLAAIDVSDPGNPKLLSRLPLPGFPQDVEIAGEYAYVVNGRSLIVIDISSPADTKIVKSVRVASEPMLGPQGIEVSGDTAYLACRRDGVRVVDITRPGDPQLLARCPTPGFARDLTASGGFLYVACDTKGMAVLDASNPAETHLVRHLDAPSGVIGDVSVTDGMAYLAGGNVVAACVSVADPADAQWVGHTSERDILSPFYGSYCYAVATVEDPGSKAAYVYAADAEAGLLVIDVSDPEEPFFAGALMGNVSLGGHLFTGLSIEDSVAYVNDESYGLRVVDISVPTRPRLLGEGINLK